MKILIIDNGTKHLEDLLWLCSQHDVEVQSFGSLIAVEGYDLCMLSGWSYHSIFHDPNPYQSEIDFLLQTDKPVIGICLGAQIMAQAYGSRFCKLPERVHQQIEINYKKNVYVVEEAHRFAIETLGDELLSLASSSYGHEIITHKKKPQRGFQFHPEKHMSTTQWKELLSLVTWIDF
jgi:carbamoylphosphate synthase small subunit